MLFTHHGKLLNCQIFCWQILGQTRSDQITESTWRLFNYCLVLTSSLLKVLYPVFLNCFLVRRRKVILMNHCYQQGKMSLKNRRFEIIQQYWWNRLKKDGATKSAKSKSKRIAPQALLQRGHYQQHTCTAIDQQKGTSDKKHWGRSNSNLITQQVVELDSGQQFPAVHIND